MYISAMCNLLSIGTKYSKKSIWFLCLLNAILLYINCSGHSESSVECSEEYFSPIKFYCILSISIYAYWFYIKRSLFYTVLCVKLRDVMWHRATNHEELWNLKKNEREKKTNRVDACTHKTLCIKWIFLSENGDHRAVKEYVWCFWCVLCCFFVFTDFSRYNSSLVRVVQAKKI